MNLKSKIIGSAVFHSYHGVAFQVLSALSLGFFHRHLQL